VEYREANGPFESVEELMEVSGIGEGKFAGLEGRITVNGEDAE
jgi:competence protein ComEA